MMEKFCRIENNVKVRLLLQGTMPERALLRLRRAGIAVYHAKKIEPKKLRLDVKKKDVEKVFAIFCGACYNISTYSAYTVTALGERGIYKYLRIVKNRAGLVLGGLLFVATVAFFDGFVFAVDFEGANVYQREARIALEEQGIRLFSPYDEEGAKGVVTKLLALDGMEYCAVKKSGMRVTVELRLSPFQTAQLQSGNMQAKHSGILLSLVTLRGEAQKKAGEKVRKGEVLVSDSFTTTDGGQVRVEPIAYARVACTHESVYDAKNETEAFAKAYLALGFSGEERITKREITPMGTGYKVYLCYEEIERMNF